DWKTDANSNDVFFEESSSSNEICSCGANIAVGKAHSMGCTVYAHQSAKKDRNDDDVDPNDDEEKN
ncbi:MAG: hypothetical protein NTX86_03165, partial [Candidatus Dependentiae bacterium]|nr:hypothetical protein [Candidatus Dependentiae bacterium]